MPKLINTRLQRLEAAALCKTGDVRAMTDQQLMDIVRQGLRELRAKDRLTEQEQRDLELFESALAEE